MVYGYCNSYSLEIFRMPGYFRSIRCMLMAWLVSGINIVLFFGSYEIHGTSMRYGTSMTCRSFRSCPNMSKQTNPWISHGYRHVRRLRRTRHVPLPWRHIDWAQLSLSQEGAIGTKPWPSKYQGLDRLKIPRIMGRLKVILQLSMSNPLVKLAAEHRIELSDQWPFLGCTRE